MLAVTVQPADEGDTTTWRETLETACQNINELRRDAATAEEVNAEGVEEVVADKGYHANETMADLAAMGVRSYVAEPRRGRRDWQGKQEARDAVYANRPPGGGAEVGKRQISPTATSRATGVKPSKPAIAAPLARVPSLWQY